MAGYVWEEAKEQAEEKEEVLEQIQQASGMNLIASTSALKGHLSLFYLVYYVYELCN